MGIDQKVFDRLVELGEGAEPDSLHCGICNDIDTTLFEDYGPFNGYDYLEQVFEEMGLDPQDPLKVRGASYMKRGNLWSGEEGEIRRAFCLELAGWIKQNRL